MNFRSFLKRVGTEQVQPIKIPSGVTEGFVRSEVPETSQELRRRDLVGTDYALRYRLQEEELQEVHNF